MKAAQESHRVGIGDDRNDAVKDLFNDAAASTEKSATPPPLP